jgi:hypothetical protein
VQYQHTQRGTATVAACGAGIVALVVWSVFLPAPIGIVLTAIAVLIACAICFSSLTIQVTDQQLSWRFGLGLFRKALPLAAIQGTEILRIPLLYGWGIHRTPQGWLYNVSGRQALVIRLQNDTAVLLGTDEPERLQAALRRTSDAVR